MIRSFLTLGFLGAAASLPAAWTTDCPACAAHLGGSGRAGPYATAADCEAARQQALANNLPYGPCTSDSSGTDSSGGSPQQQLQQDTSQALTQGIVNGNAQEIGVGMAGLGVMGLMAGIQAQQQQEAQAQQQALEEERQNALAANQLHQSGLWYLRQNDPGDAIIEFQKALQREPGDADIQADLDRAEALKFSNDKQSALGELKGGDGAEAMSADNGGDDTLKPDGGPAAGATGSDLDESLKPDTAPTSLPATTDLSDRPWTPPAARFEDLPGVAVLNSTGVVADTAQLDQAETQADQTAAVSGWSVDQAAALADPATGQGQMASAAVGVATGQAMDKAKEAGLDLVGGSAGLVDAGGMLLNTASGAVALNSLAHGDSAEAVKGGVEMVAGGLTWTSGMALTGGQAVGHFARDRMVGFFDAANGAAADLGEGSANAESGATAYKAMVESMPTGCQWVAASVGMAPE